MMEMVLIGPWIFFLAIGALDWGFYSSALVSVESAARSAALYTSSSSTGTATDLSNACKIVMGEMQRVPNVTTCGSNPVVTATLVNPGPDSAPAAQVSVTYQSISLIPIPDVLAKQFTVTRTVTMRCRP
jgi:Flp pilus assembly protein TadG